MSSKKVNGMLRLGELTDSNISKYSKIKLEEGRLPKAPNEIVISTFHNPSKLKAGDSIFITTFTPEKIINATQLKVVGVGKLRTNSLVTHEGMAALMNSSEYANTVIIYNAQDIPEKTKVAETVLNTKALMKTNGIEVKEVEDYFTQMKQLQILVVVFNGLKIIMLGIMFPLIGAVLGAIVWIHVYKRRKELWTYSSIGMKDKALTNLMLIEYWIIGLAGMVVGVIGGVISSYFAETSGARVYFQFLMDLPMTLTIGVIDVLIILAFVFVCILAWATPPIRKIVKAKPFSY